jgi:hypothetical protein
MSVSVSMCVGHTMRGFSWFPAIGAVIGGWAAVWFDAAVAVWPEPAVAACISTSATVKYTHNIYIYIYIYIYIVS